MYDFTKLHHCVSPRVFSLRSPVWTKKSVPDAASRVRVAAVSTEFCPRSPAAPKENDLAGGDPEPTTKVRVAVAVWPAPSVAITLTIRLPALAYAWTTAGPVPVAPSPKAQAYAYGGAPPAGVAVKDTGSPTTGSRGAAEASTNRGRSGPGDTMLNECWKDPEKLDTASIRSEVTVYRMNPYPKPGVFVPMIAA